ncbi:MAG: Fur family transcriptional regulator [Rhizobiaceae bacterium]
MAGHKGLRWTGQRRAIAAVLARSKDHPDVYELYRRVSELDGRVSLATIYRTVRCFQKEGIVERQEFRNFPHRYEMVSGRHHDHLIDVETGKVIEFVSPEIERLQVIIAKRLGFRLEGHKLELYATRRKTKKDKV